jgi:hypothetical protein
LHILKLLMVEKDPFYYIKSLIFQFFAHNFSLPKKNLHTVAVQGPLQVLVKTTFPHISSF